MSCPATLRHREKREKIIQTLIGESVPDLAGEYADVTKVHHPITILTTYSNSIITHSSELQCFCTSLKGLVMLASICQSTVLHTLRLWSSAWEAMYFPTGSHVRPLTNPVCPRRHVTISGETQRRRRHG